MSKTKRYIVIFLLCFLMLIAIMIFTAPTMAETESEEMRVAPVIETVQPREIAHKAFKAPDIPTHTQESEKTAESTEALSNESVDYAALVDLDEWGESVIYLAKTV